MTTDASEGALTGIRKLRYRFHVAVCPYCKAHLHQVETTVKTLAILPQEPPSEKDRERALTAFRNRTKGSV